MIVNRQVFERYFTETEERQLFTAVKSVNDVFAQRDYAWMRLLRQTGLRVGSLARLTVYDARTALKVGYLSVRNVKVKTHPYKIYMTKPAKVALTELLRIRKRMGFYEDPDAPLVMSRKHNALSVRAFQQRMQHWVTESGLHVQGSPHWFRHTLAKRIVSRSQSNNPTAVVSRVLGHSSPSSTAVYTQPDREDVELDLEIASR